MTGSPFQLLALVTLPVNDDVVDFLLGKDLSGAGQSAKEGETVANHERVRGLSAPSLRRYGQVAIDGGDPTAEARVATEELGEAGQILIPLDETVFVESGQNILGASPLDRRSVSNEFPLPKHKQVGEEQYDDSADRNPYPKFDGRDQTENGRLFDGVPVIHVPVFMSKDAAQCSMR